LPNWLRAYGEARRRLAVEQGRITVVTENTSDFEPFAELSEMAGLEAGIRLENWFDE
jgi:hypothetical protein